MCFDTLFFESILLNNAISEGFLKWAELHSIFESNVWLVPINHANHWTLLVVIVNAKSMIYLDSGHDPSQTKKMTDKALKSFIKKKCGQFINGICSFMINEQNDIVWEEWSLFVIPSQRTEERGLGGNCGVHMCSWALCIATCSGVKFDESAMDIARMGIANMLFYAKTKAKITKKTNERRRYIFAEGELEEKRRILPFVDRMKIFANTPPLHFETTNDFCSTLRLLQPNYKNKRY